MIMNEIIKAHNSLNEIFGFGKKKEDERLSGLSPAERSEYDRLTADSDEPTANIDKRIEQAKFNVNSTPEEKAEAKAQARADAVAKAKQQLKYELSPVGMLDKEKQQAAQARSQQDARQDALDRHNAEVDRLSMNIQIGDIRFTPYQLDQMKTRLKALQAKQW